MTISFVESNKINSPGTISGDLADPPEIYLSSYYGNVDFGFDITLSKDDVGERSYTVTDVTYTASEDTAFLEAEILDANTIRITKLSSPFITETYEYRLAANTSVVAYTEADLDGQPDVFGMTRWTYPDDPKYVLVNHDVTVSGVSDLGVEFTESVLIPQYFYWKVQPALEQFDQLIAQEYA